ncbi:uncharacterized protein SRS1_17432 [Sporisorium reilianum f. sp. reilianum]|uniref:Uncharacterized protein n=1 Tax=Sporisorium reilianum f. sp. reilianum TaxID=72559 RepID=A0A2N8UG46_9BASI|nr:uncharacterized protein SRS1_17432 [Sporisorium reilianum f. sp. reilianum]
MGRLVQTSYKGQYVCQNRRATSRIRILGDFVSRTSLNYAKDTMKAFLEREQTVENRDVCYNNARWNSNVWKTIPSAKVKHTLPSGRVNTMMVTVELEFESNNAFRLCMQHATLASWRTPRRWIHGSGHFGTGRMQLTREGRFDVLAGQERSCDGRKGSRQRAEMLRRCAKERAWDGFESNTVRK